MSPSMLSEYQKLCPWSIIAGQVCGGTCPYKHDQVLLKAAWEEHGLTPKAPSANSQARASSSKTTTTGNEVIANLPKYAFLCREFTAGNGCKNKSEGCHYIHDSDLHQAVLNVEALAKRAQEELESCDEHKSYRVCHFYTTATRCMKGNSCYFIHDSTLRDAALKVIAKYQVLLALPKDLQVKQYNGWQQRGTVTEIKNNNSPNSGKPKADGTFCLPDLPGELRNKIWTTILHEFPYTAWIRLCEVKDSYDRPTGYRMVSESRPPLLLHLCRESRIVALQHYSLCFGTDVSPPRVYFNFNTDAAYLNTRNIRELDIFKNNLSGHVKRNLRNMILKVKDWAGSGEVTFAEFMWQFVRIRQLLMVVGRDKEDQIYIDNPELPAVVELELRRKKKATNRWIPPQIYVEECPELKGFSHKYR